MTMALPPLQTLYLDIKNLFGGTIAARCLLPKSSYTHNPLSRTLPCLSEIQAGPISSHSFRYASSLAGGTKVPEAQCAVADYIVNGT